MKKSALFISYKFGNPDAEALRRICGEVAERLGRIAVADGKSLPLLKEFSPEIADFIRESAECSLALFTEGDHHNVNVIYEIGIAVGARRNVVLVAEKMEFIPSMLRSRDIVFFDRSALEWQPDFSARLEHKLRAIYGLEGDHRIEEKLRRRYSPDEIRNFNRASATQAIIEAVRVGNLDKAESMVRARLQQDTENADYYFLLSEIHYLHGCVEEHPEEVAAAFRRQLDTTNEGLAYQARSVNLLSSRSRALIRLGKLEDALSTLELLLAEDPDYSVGHYDAACLHALVGRREAMLESLGQAIALFEEWRDFARSDPDFSDYWTDSAWRKLVYVA